MKFKLPALIALIVLAQPAWAGMSRITVVEGRACMGYDHSRRDTEKMALDDAKTKAVEYSATEVKSKATYKNELLDESLATAYSKGTATILEELEKEWFDDERLGECCRIKVKAEVVPDKETRSETKPAEDESPAAPLNVKLWTDKESFAQGERMKIYIKGNKPFFARVVYEDASGNLIQLLPNPYRQKNYFEGGTVHEIPSGLDAFDLKVKPPFGKEKISVYASTSQLGTIDLKDAGSVYQVTSNRGDVGIRTRGVAVEPREGNGGVSEFWETEKEIVTGP